MIKSVCNLLLCVPPLLVVQPGYNGWTMASDHLEERPSRGMPGSRRSLWRDHEVPFTHL